MDLFGKTARKADHIRKYLLSRHGRGGSFEHCLNLLSDEDLIHRHDAHHMEQVAREKQKSQAGFAALISMLIACAVMLVLLGAFLPNTIRSAQVANNQNAASWLAQVNTAESSYATYGGYITPSSLAGSVQAKVAGAAACANPMLIPGTIVGSPTVPGSPVGYTMSFTPGGTATGYGCVGGPATAYQNYSITLTPNSKLQAGDIHFFSCLGTGCDGQAHFASARAALETDPVWTTTIPGTSGGSGGGTQNSGSTTILMGNWSAGGAYAAGQEVLYPNGTNSVGLFANLLGSNSAAGQNPAGDATNWIQIASYSTAPPSLTGSFTGTQLLGGSFYTCPVSGLNCSPVKTSGTIPSNYTTLISSFTMTSFTVTMSPQNGGNALSIYTQPLPNPSGPANLGCTIPAYGTTCTVNISPVVLPAGSQMEIVVTPGLSYAAESLVWSIS